MSDKPHTKSVNKGSSEEPRTRSEQKQETRQALLGAALEILQTTSFDSLRLRKVAREAGVAPAAIYRHFADMDALGVALVAECFRPLREMIREGTSDLAKGEYKHVIKIAASTLVRHIRANRGEFSFVARNRFSGNVAVRTAIRAEIKLFASELATDFARFPGLESWSSEDLQLLASLQVDTAVSAVEEILSQPPDDLPYGEDAAIRWVERRMLMIALGATAWRSA